MSDPVHISLDLTEGRPGKWCIECGIKWPLEFFRANPGKHACQDERRPRCKRCEGESRHEVDYVVRWLQSSLTRHARQDGFPDRHALERATGVGEAYLLPIVMREREHGRCPHCDLTWHDLFTKFNERMTLDRIHRDRPITRSNVQLMCGTGNGQKSRTDPTEFDITSQCWRLAKKIGRAYQQLALKIDL